MASSGSSGIFHFHSKRIAPHRWKVELCTWHVRRGFASFVHCLVSNHPKLNELKQQPFHLLIILLVGSLSWVQWCSSLLVLPGIPHRAAVIWGLPGAEWSTNGHAPMAGSCCLLMAGLLSSHGPSPSRSLSFLACQHCVPKREDKRL